ncbi:MAG: acyltransferase [Candidatus Marinimicrobia bacterium]|jgi:hypothetical protein|nr:acyltransferase [Candidatus Neomarinimicrobiota bacterium]MBT3495779.1 acyltransferase [Candidatus Neomarinimicrobiota bacterium]MBT3691660.1 acyltransferase [Candidatus Neomarinimicrobiota bacterium]MBT3732753.1 acyltransferase [Candidatus Neomarinimicrobiota bacterium]MBT4145035.1 acyltransferase [Candidatus Neomarinimicrobiota bacterium]
MNQRIYFLDNLRTFMVFLVVVIHAGLVYELVLDGFWIVSDPAKNDFIGLVRLVLDVFVMFTIFFISGFFMPNSVQRKSPVEFVISKFKRILLPWLIAVLTLIPIYKMIFLFSREMPQEEWFSYFHWFNKTGVSPELFSDNPVQNWLWFLPVLFLFQLAYLGLSKIKINLNVSFKMGVILTIILSLVYSMTISEMDLTGWHHSLLLHFQRERFLIYFFVFLMGALAHEQNVFAFENRNKKQVIILNVVLSFALTIYIVTALNLFFNIIDPEREFYIVSKFVDRVTFYSSLILSMLSFLYVLVDFFRFNFNKTNRLMTEMNRNSYYVYIIHVIVIGIFALGLLHVTLPVFVKFIILSILSFIGSHAIVFGCKKMLK